MNIGSAREVVPARPGRVALNRFAGALARPLSGRLRYKRHLGWQRVVFLLPTLLAMIYYGTIASDRYVSEAKIVVRRASEQAPASGFASFLKSTGLGGPDDINSVQAYILSRDAIRALREKLPVREIFNHPSADFIARWPSVNYGDTEEDFYRYYLTVVSATADHKTGGLTVSVQAFVPEQAKAVAAALVDLAEALVNRLNGRVQSESVKSAEEEVERSEQALIASQVALTEFRNRELILDPQRSAVLISELIGRLNTELASLLAQTAQLRESAPNNPQLSSLNERARSISQQIEAQRNVISSAGSGLADKVSEYERLDLEQQFAARRLATAVASLTAAKAQARRQQIFLARIVEPSFPDKSTRPDRFFSILTIFGWSVLFYLVIWVVGAGIREHAAGHMN